MTSLSLHNTRTRAREVFEPIDPANVRVYLCGPTVYDLAHIGNARNVVVFDILVRLLRRLYPRVTYVRNITDVDDKINARFAETGEPIASITARTAADYHADMAALFTLPPDIEPRATAHIAEIIMIIERLIERGHAYEAAGHVLFAVNSDPNYGKFPAAQPRILSLARGSMSHPISASQAISYYGNLQRRSCRAGSRRGAAAGPAGTSNARPCRGATLARASTSMAAAMT